MKWVSTFLLILIGFQPIIARDQDQNEKGYYNQLYYLCNVWGHAKYYHPNIARGDLDWDEELFKAIRNIEKGSSNDTFNEVVLSMLRAAGPIERTLPNTIHFPDSLNNNKDLSWIEDDLFDNPVKENLDSIITYFYPQNNVYLDRAFTDGNPTFLTDSTYYHSDPYPNLELRLLALFRYWNFINYFFPYKYMMDQDWDTTLVEFIPPIVESNDALSYHLAFKELTTRINDSHAYFYSPTFGAWNGGYYPPFAVRFIENEMVVTKTLPSISEIERGDVIKEIDGKNIYDLRNELRKYAYGSNKVIVERELNRLILSGHEGQFNLKVENATGSKEVTLERNDSNRGLINVGGTHIRSWKKIRSIGGCVYGIVDMSVLESEGVHLVFENLQDADAIIFDVRNYPNGTLWTLVNFLFDAPIHIASFTVPDIRYPGKLYWYDVTIGYGIPNPYQGKIAILFDERTQSQAEYTIMGLEQFPDAIKIGSTTAGADGNVSAVYLPGQIFTYFTGLGTYYPDHTETQRIGIIPDIEVLPTIDGIRKGRDEVLVKALQTVLECDVTAINELPSEDLNIFPNPVNSELHYQILEDNPPPPYCFEVYDVLGNIVLSEIQSDFEGSILLPEIQPGIYIIRIFSNTQIIGLKRIVIE